MDIVTQSALLAIVMCCEHPMVGLSQLSPRHSRNPAGTDIDWTLLESLLRDDSGPFVLTTLNRTEPAGGASGDGVVHTVLNPNP
jgi:hypothetical protein